MSKVLKELSGKISEDLKEVPVFLSNKLGIKEHKGPQAFYNMCKAEGFKCELDFPNDTFKVYYALEEVQEVQEAQEVQEVQEEVSEPIEVNSSPDLEDDDFDFLADPD